METPTKTNPEQSPGVQATPTTVRRSRRASKQAESPTRSQLTKSEGGPLASPRVSTLKRCTRASRLHSPEQPSTPLGSTHEGDTSDLESCCSVVSDIDLPVTCTSRRRWPHATSQKDEISEVDSCSSAVSTSSTGRSRRRITGTKTVPESSKPARVEVEDVKVNQVLETKSCSSVLSDSKRVTRSQRRSASTRLSSRKQTEDSELSDADSCTSSISGAEVSKSTTRRTTRSMRQTSPIPMHLDEASESSLSPAQTGRRTRAARGKAASNADTSEPQSCGSEGFDSQPTYSMTTQRQGKTQSTGAKAMDSDSELTEVYSPTGSSCSTPARGTPCSSRTGSNNSSRGAPASRRSVRDLSIVMEKVGEQTEEDSLSASRLDSTVTAEDAECTLLEEDESQTLEEEKGVNSTDFASNKADRKTVEKGVNAIPNEDSHGSSSLLDSAGCAEAVISGPAVVARDQQEELSTENNNGDTSEMEKMQEVIPSSELLKPCQSVTVAMCDNATEITEEKGEAMEVIVVDTHSSQRDEDAFVETRPSVVEKMEVSTLKVNAQQVVASSESHVESVQVTSNQQCKITVESELPSANVTTKVISPLESSDDEDEYAGEEEDRDGSVDEEEEDLGCRKDERAGPSRKSEVPAASVEGLFMIDTRPGQEADELYYKEKPTVEVAGKDAEQEAQDEEFVDEEGDDDDDDEDAKILFSGRSSQLKELSSRIDPGIRVKELGGLYINFDGSKSKPGSSSLQKLKEKKLQDEVMKKSVIGPDFEKKDAVPPYSESKQALKLKHRAEREKSTGDGWFNMKAPEITQELKGDLQVLKMRGSLDPKRFYKKNDRDGFPKYFQVGSVMDNAVDFYHSRIPKKERKRTMVEELLADAEFRHTNKKKYQHIMMERAAKGAGKRHKKKFHKR